MWGEGCEFFYLQNKGWQFFGLWQSVNLGSTPFWGKWQPLIDSELEAKNQSASKQLCFVQPEVYSNFVALSQPFHLGIVHSHFVCAEIWLPNKMSAYVIALMCVHTKEFKRGYQVSVWLLWNAKDVTAIWQLCMEGELMYFRSDLRKLFLPRVHHVIS